MRIYIVQNNQQEAIIYINEIYSRASIIFNRMTMPDISSNPLIEYAVRDLLTALADTLHQNESILPHRNDDDII